MTDSKLINKKLKKIKILVMDVDGTLTNGKVFYSKNGEELKQFSIRDGMGIELLRRADIQTGIITSENSPIVTARAAKLKIEHVILGSRNKKKDFEQLADDLKLELNEIAYIGDDINDIQVLQIAGLAACPKDSVKKVKEISDYICKAEGGDGAIRELAEMILKSQNKSIILPENW